MTRRIVAALLCAAALAGCGSSSKDSCAPACGASQCGDDGCGGTCGTCTASAVCSAGRCVAACTPACAGRQCGDDGCGGTCGTCTAGAVCSAGRCAAACTPACAGRQCGDDGCGGSCGSCATGLGCTTAGACVVPRCPSPNQTCVVEQHTAYQYTCVYQPPAPTTCERLWEIGSYSSFDDCWTACAGGNSSCGNQFGRMDPEVAACLACADSCVPATRGACPADPAGGCPAPCWCQ
jgi:hypothetical protein